jgi:hypothetical protein
VERLRIAYEMPIDRHLIEVMTLTLL